MTDRKLEDWEAVLEAELIHWQAQH